MMATGVCVITLVSRAVSAPSSPVTVTVVAWKVTLM
jgi:hypothetical protein